MIDGRFFQGDPLKGTKWENLTFDEYHDEMSDDERKELKEHLESIKAPFTWGVFTREDFYPRGYNRTWRDIVLMSKEQLDDYHFYIWKRDALHREITSQANLDESVEDMILGDLYAFGNPLEGTKWENLTEQQFTTRLSDEERDEIEEYLVSINAPSMTNYEGWEHLDWWTWRDIASTALEVVWEKFNIPGAYEYIKELGLYKSTEDIH